MKPSELDFRALLAHYEIFLSQDNGMKGMCICPFHEDHSPSLSLDFSRNLYYCFVCAEGGSIVNFVMNKEGIDYAQAIGWLNDLFGSDMVAGTGAHSVFPKSVIEDRALNIFWFSWFHYLVLLGSGVSFKIDSFYPNLVTCQMMAEKQLHKERVLEMDRRRYPMKYIFKDLCEEIAYLNGLISSEWTARCMADDHVKMLQVAHELSNPDLYFGHWEDGIDRLVIERDLLVEIKRLSMKFTGRAEDVLADENKNRVEKMKYLLIDWLSILKKIAKDGILKNSALILEASL